MKNPKAMQEKCVFFLIKKTNAMQYKTARASSVNVH